MKTLLKKKSQILLVATCGIFILFFIVILSKNLKYKAYQKLALQNVIYEEIQYAARGNIYDRKNRTIVSNLLSYDLVVVPKRITPQTDTTLLCQLLGISKNQWNERIEKHIEKNRLYRESIFEPYLSHKIQNQIQEHLWKLEGFQLRRHDLRSYNYPHAFHALGYIGRVNSEEIEAQPEEHSLFSYIGKTGVEKQYNELLKGEDGKQYWLRDNQNQIVEKYDDGNMNISFIKGKSLITSLDIELQSLAEQLLGNKAGAIIAIEPSTGEILCMASSPTINAQLFRQDIRTEYYNTLSADPNAPFLNRALRGRYSPGSVFKIIESILALDDKVIDTSYGYDCRGYYTRCIKKVRCEHNEPHHAKNLRLAIANSCNSYFSNLLKLWIDSVSSKTPSVHPMNQFKTKLESIGIGVKLGVDIGGEMEGFIPDSAYYTNYYGNTRWNFCTVKSLGIGQGELLITPLQLANFMCVIANYGKYYPPHFAKEIWDEKNNLTKKINYDKKIISSANEQIFHIISDAMHEVVKSGTAQNAYVKDIPISGKTGTVENYTVQNGKRIKLKDNAIFAGFAPKDNPKIAFAVIVENAGYASTWAVPMAALLVERYINDSLSLKSMKRVEAISKQNLLPIP